MKNKKVFLFAVALALVLVSGNAQAWANSTYSWRMPLTFNNSEGQASLTNVPIDVNVTGLHDLGGTCGSIRLYANYSSETEIGFEVRGGDGATWCLLRIPLNMSSSQNATYFLNNASAGVNVYFLNDSTILNETLPTPDWNFDAAITIAPSGMTGEGTAVFFSAAYAANQQSFTAEAFSNRRIFGVKVKLTNATNSPNLNSWFQLRPDVHSGDSASISESATPFNTLNITSCSDYVTSLFNVSSTLTASALYAIRWSSHGVWSGVVSSDSCSANPGGYAGGSYYYRDAGVDLTPRDWNSIILVTSAVDAAQGVEQSDIAAGHDVLIYAPSNASFAQSSFVLNFTYYSETIASGGDCEFFLDGVSNWTGTVANWTETILPFSVGSLGSHSVNLTCVDNVSADYSTKLVAFSVVPYIVVNSSYSSSAFELQPTTFVSNIQVASAFVSNASAVVTWNGTALSATQTKSGNNYSFTLTYLPNLIQVNATPVSFYWNYTLAGLGATYNSSASIQTVLFSYWLNSFSLTPSAVLSYEPVTMTSNLTMNSALATVSVVHDFNNSFGAASLVGGVFVSSDLAPVVAGNATVTANSTATVSFGGFSRSMTSVNATTDVYSLTIVFDCSAGAPFLNFTVRDEENQSLIDANHEIALMIFNSARTHNYTLNVSVASVPNLTICISPSWAVVQADSFQTYVAPGYDQRSYFLDNATLSNATAQMQLFLLSSSVGLLSNVLVQDANNNPVSNAVVYFERYYIGNASYLTVAMVKTDEHGQANTYLRPNDIYYKIVVVVNHVVVKEFPLQTISCTASPCAIVLPLSPGSLGEYWNYFDQVAYGCAFNNATGNLSCSIVDSSGLMRSSNLTVIRRGVMSWITVCSVASTSSAATLVCGLTNSSDYSYSLTAEFASTTYLLLAEDIVPASTSTGFGDDSLIIAIMIIFGLAFVGLWNPAISIMFAGLGLIISFMLGLLLFSFASLVGILAVIVILVYKMKS